MRSTSNCLTVRSRNSMTSSKLCPVSTCITGNGMRAGKERPLGEVEHHDGVLAAGEQQDRALALGGDLADDRDRFVLEAAGGDCRGAHHRDISAKSHKSDRSSHISRPSLVSRRWTGTYDRWHARHARHPAPRPEHVEPREPVHRLARRRRSPSRARPRRSPPASRWPMPGCASTRRTLRCWCAPSPPTTSPSSRWASNGCPCGATGGSTSGTTAPCRDSTRRRPPSATAPSRPTCGGAASTCRRRRSTRAARSTRRTTGATGCCHARCCPPASASPTSSPASSPTGRT